MIAAVKSYALLLDCLSSPCLQTHIENVATDLAWDAIARFGGEPSYQLPWQFYDDFVTVSGGWWGLGKGWLCWVQRLLGPGVEAEAPLTTNAAAGSSGAPCPTQPPLLLPQLQPHVPTCAATCAATRPTPPYLPPPTPNSQLPNPKPLNP